MRTLGRRAAIGATSLSLALAGAGSGVAAVRSADVWENPPRSNPTGSNSPTTLTESVADVRFAPTSELGIEATITAGDKRPTFEVPSLTSSTLPAPLSSASGGLGGTEGLGGTVTTLGSPLTLLPSGTGLGTVPTSLGPVGGPRPTTTTTPMTATAPCPIDTGQGALPPAVGQFRAVNFTLPWPGLGPVVLAPQVSATQGPSGPARITAASLGSFAPDGSSLTVLASLPVVYTLQAGQDRTNGSIRFVGSGAVEHITEQACRARSVTIFDVASGTLNGSPLRIVGVMAQAGSVSVENNGGTARFRAVAVGKYTVALVTANDAGEAGRLIAITINVV